MKALPKSLFQTLAALAAMALPIQPALASVTLNGTLPPGTAPVVVLQANNQSGATDSIKFKFSAPAVNAGVAYALSYCIGPASNPCASPTSFVVQVPAGQSRLAVISASVFATNVLVVGQGTRRAVPFSVTME